MIDLRERFRMLDDVPVPDLPSPARTARSMSDWRRPLVLRRSGAVMTALVVTIASLTILVRAFRAAPPTHEPVDADTGSLSIDAGPPVAVGDAPNAVAAGGGAIWVSAHPADGPPYELVRLDPLSGDIEARIQVPALPTWEVGGGGLVALPDGVWVTGAVDPRRATLFRVNPRTNDVDERVDLGSGVGADVWVDGTGVWVLVFEEDPRPGMAVVRLDPVSLDQVARISLPTDWAKQIFAFDGSIWVQGNREGGSEGGGVVPDVLFRIDPATNRYVGSVDLPSQGFSLAVDGTSIWQRAADGVIRFDPTGSLTRVPIDGMEGSCCSHIASDGLGGLWVVVRGDGPRSSRVSHVSADGQLDARAEVAVPAAVLESVTMTFDADHQTLWLAQYERTVTPLRLSVS